MPVATAPTRSSNATYWLFDALAQGLPSLNAIAREIEIPTDSAAAELAHDAFTTAESLLDRANQILDRHALRTRGYVALDALLDLAHDHTAPARDRRLAAQSAITLINNLREPRAQARESSSSPTTLAPQAQPQSSPSSASVSPSEALREPRAQAREYSASSLSPSDEKRTTPHEQRPSPSPLPPLPAPLSLFDHSTAPILAADAATLITSALEPSPEPSLPALLRACAGTAQSILSPLFAQPGHPAPILTPDSLAPS